MTRFKGHLANVLLSPCIFKSITGKTVKLTAERVEHILSRHPELSQITELIAPIKIMIEKPDYVVLGTYGEPIAIRRLEKSRYLVVPYFNDGEVKTAYNNRIT